ncbi:MAG: SagB/ThcOx family dehydrogenase [Planctomycetes bacterium]|nr:SagB/ThcOx family dehydrogenase [Planctomycetota bacterium]
MSDPAGEAVRAYHRRTKHQPERYARSLGYLDWATQPDPYRRFTGAPRLALDLCADAGPPRYDALFVPGSVPVRPWDRAAVSELFHASFALSAWKEVPGSRWALRVNPSSGNLHPTEAYLLSAPVDGFGADAMLAHYQPFAHALEVRRRFDPGLWRTLLGDLPADSALVGLSSIFWRESWKYGERAFRYCQHDVGHALGALAMAAALLGREARLLPAPGDAEVALLLGIAGQSGIEAEHPDALVVLAPVGRLDQAVVERWRPDAAALERLQERPLLGTAAPLSTDHHEWPAIDEVAAAAAKAPGWVRSEPAQPPPLAWPEPDRPLPARALIRGRRSAVAMDGSTGLTRDAFYGMLARVADPRRPPFHLLPWPPQLHFALFVHRVRDLPSGLYLLVRDPGQGAALRAALSGRFAWQRPAACPEGLDLVLLEAGDGRAAAASISCHQAIAADGAFALAMLARFAPALAERGAWFYRALHWEAGMLGQTLYLEAEAAGVRATGIGCFFDDAMHRLLGLAGEDSQVLYHFTVGGALEDDRLRTLPAYAHLGRPVG